MKELGENSLKIHEEILGAQQNVDEILCIGDLWADVKIPHHKLKVLIRIMNMLFLKLIKMFVIG